MLLCRLMLLMIFSCPASISCQSFRLQRTLKPAIDGAYSNHFIQVIAGLTNPSSLARLNEFAAGGCREQTFLLKELGLFAAIGAQPVGSGVIGVAVQHSGPAGFRETAFKVLYALQLGKADLGTEFTFHHTGITGYPATIGINAGISCTWKLSPKCAAGINIKNLAGLFILQNKNFYAPVFQLGVGYDISTLVHLGFEWIRESGRPHRGVTGVLYQFHHNCLLQLGIALPLAQPYGGVQLIRDKWALQLRTSYDVRLGWSPLIGLSYQSLFNTQAE